MLSKTRLLMVAMLAALAVSAVASSAAFATPEYLVGGKSAGKEELKELLTAGDYILTGELLGVKVEILCLDATVLPGSTIENVGGIGLSVANVDFSECTVLKPAGCKVKEPIELVKTLDELKGAKAPFTDLFKPEAGKPFVELTLTGCIVAGTFKVEGEQECKLPGGEVEAVEHKIECLATGSKLKFGGNPATFSGTFNVALKSGAKWDVS